MEVSQLPRERQQMALTPPMSTRSDTKRSRVWIGR